MAQAIKNWRLWFVFSLVFIVGAGVYLFPRLNENRSYQGAELSGLAPDFELMDQNGNPISLSDFRGRVVVLTFMDSQCMDVCPLTSAHLLQAYERLDKSETDQVVFLAVNVNIRANTAADVSDATRNWRLEKIPDWHFLTADSDDLESVWRDYGIAVEANSGEILHTPGVFLIDPEGQKRWYISTSYSENGNAEWTLPLNELLVGHIRRLLQEN